MRDGVPRTVHKRFVGGSCARNGEIAGTDDIVPASVSRPRFYLNAWHQEELVELIYCRHQSGCPLQDAEEDVPGSYSSCFDAAVVLRLKRFFPCFISSGCRYSSPFVGMKRTTCPPRLAFFLVSPPIAESEVLSWANA